MMAKLNCRPPDNVPEDTPVIVTFLGTHHIDLRERGISEEQAAEL